MRLQYQAGVEIAWLITDLYHNSHTTCLKQKKDIRVNYKHYHALSNILQSSSSLIKITLLITCLSMRHATEI